MIVFRNLNPIEVNEGDSQIVVEIDPSASGITGITSLQISTVDGSAVSTSFDEEEVGVDFDAIPSSIVIVNPEDPETLAFTIDITDDAIAETDESFQFQVTAVEDASSNGTANIIITDNDGTDEPELEVDGLLPRINIADIEQLEGDSGNTNFEFIVSLSSASDESVTVNYATANGTAETEDILEDTVLIDAADYISTDGILEFEPGETEKTITVEVLTENLSLSNEAPEETFFVNLDNAINADFDNFIATGTILDDDLEDALNNTLPVVSIENQTFTEADLGENTTQQLEVSLVDANGERFIATEDITFSYGTSDITAVASADYEFIDSQTATIPQGQSTTTIPLTILGDDIIEDDETFSVNLSDDFNLAEFNNDAISITIEDNDGFMDEEPEPEENLDSNDIRESNVFRFLNAATGTHFYTASVTERDFIEDNLDTFQLEDSSFASVNPDNLESAEEIYRFFNTATGGHFYTGDEFERDFIIDNLDNFVFEDVAFFAFETNIEDTIPVYRFYEPNLGVHFYTGSETERTFVEDNLSNYDFEGIAYYALPVVSDSV